MPFATPDEIPREVAARSHAGTSWDPERRAEQARQEYAARLNQAYDQAMATAKTPAQQEAARAALEDLRTRYRQAYVAYLAAHGNVTSWMITGRSGRNARREEKRSDTADRRMQEAEETWERGIKRVGQAIAAARVADAGGPAAMDRAKLDNLRKLQETMKAANRIVRSAASDEDKVARIAALGMKESTARQLLEPDFAGRKGFPDYAMTNNLATIKRLEAKVAAEAAPREAASEIEIPGGITVARNTDLDRLQLFFPGKPDEATRAQLKARGFHWSPREGAWQRQLTPAAVAAAEAVLGAKLDRPAAPAPGGPTVVDGRCRAAGGRFLPNVACGLPEPPPREPCRDGEGRFLPTPGCRGLRRREEQEPVSGLGGAPAGWRRRLHLDFAFLFTPPARRW